ncbi:MAG: deoxynucleoside kinase [Clostridia bacterium]|nr:deoxynucleoside kinase [Clostridia bacterium]
MGRFIVIDGLDGSGKETQSLILKKHLEEKGVNVRYISFPCYENDSSLFVKKYLNGELGSRPEDTNAYAASSFFAADRYLSYRTDWKKDIDDPDTVVIANRYTTANAVHQLSKLPKDEWNAFLSWLWDYEFYKLGIPVPDAVIYLEMHPDISYKLIKSRSEKTGRATDIHENDGSFLYKSYEAALYASERLNWTRICCYEGEDPLTIEEISEQVLSALGY